MKQSDEGFCAARATATAAVVAHADAAPPVARLEAPEPRPLLTSGRLLVLLLIASFLVRAILIWRGGQFYWPDEQRYELSRTAVREAMSGNVREAFTTLNSADHFLFKVIGVIPATVERVVGANDRIPALFFAMFGMCNICLVWAIALRTGAQRESALLAAVLLAISCSLLYYSRHLLPYDLAMTFGLLAVLSAVRRPARTLDACLCGLCAAACFLTYNGYWTLSLLAMLVCVLTSGKSYRQVARCGAALGLSFILPIVAVIVVGWLLGQNLIRQYVDFSATVTQGSFAEGWSLPIAYLWHCEHLLLVLWGIMLAVAMWQMAQRRAPSTVFLGLSGVCFIYGMLVLASVGLHKFVVYGRLAREIVPFLCLLSAPILWQICSTGKARRKIWILLAVLAIQTAANWYPPFAQVFPAEFRRDAEKAFPQIARGEAGFVFANHLFPVPQNVPHPGARVLMSAAHPLQYLPYQYEGYTPDQRGWLRSLDIRMRVVALPR